MKNVPKSRDSVNPGERRRHVRINLKKPMVFRFKIARDHGFQSSYEGEGEAKNISLGGMYIELPVMTEDELQRLLAGKDKLRVEVDTPHTVKGLKAKAKVIWLGKKRKTQPPIFGIGVSFEDVSDKDKIAHYMIDQSFEESLE